MLFQSFADPAEEREYCITERVARAPIIRRLAWIASLVLFLYLLVNPLFIDRSLVADFTIATIPLMASLAVYAYVTGLDAYPPRPWLDYVFFVVFGLGLAILGTIIARQAAYTRWAKSAGMEHPLMSGIWADEFGVGDVFMRFIKHHEFVETAPLMLSRREDTEHNHE